MHGLKRTAFGCLAALIVACSGLGGPSATAPLVPNATGRASGPDARSKVEARLVIHVPRRRHRHRANFISPSTKSIVITTQETSPAAGSVLKNFANIGPGAPNCKGTGSNLPYTCTVPIGSLTIGATYSIAFVTYDVTQTSANGPYHGSALARNTVSRKIVAGVDNTIGVTLEGVPVSFSIALLSSATFAGNVANGLYFGFLDSPLLEITALDADGNFIVGSGAPEIGASIGAGATGGLAIAASSNPNRFTASSKSPGTGMLKLSAPVPGSLTPLTVSVTLTAGSLTRTVAGSTGQSGTRDGTGTLAQFNAPLDVEYNPSDGQLYIADDNNCTIRKMDPSTYAVTSYAGDVVSGSPICGYQNGTGFGNSGPWLSHPTGLAFDSSGNLYVNDNNNDAIREIAPGGVTTLLTGHDGYGTAGGAPGTAQFENLRGLTYDPDDNSLYAADYDACTIRRITLTGTPGTVTTIAGTAGSCDHTGSDLFQPEGIAYAGNGSLFVADSGNCEIRRITNIDSVPQIDTIASPFAGQTSCQAGDGTGTAAGFAQPYYLKYDAAHGVLYLNDNDWAGYGGTVRRITVPGAVVTTIAGGATQYEHVDGWNALFYYNEGIGYDPASNRLYITDVETSTIGEIRL